MTEKTKTTRRGFFAGLLAGAGALAVLGGGKEASAAPQPGQVHEPILFRKTKESVRYYKTLFS